MTSTATRTETRVYLAVVGDDLDRVNMYWLGRPCTRCGSWPFDPYHRRPEPCRHPRAHAWHDVHNWRSRVGGNDPTARVLAPRVELDQDPEAIIRAARTEAARILARHADP